VTDYWDDDGDYLNDLMQEEFGPYSEDYSERPIPDDKVWSIAGTAHHPECIDRHGTDCNCKELYERDYEVRQETEAEEQHEEFWQ
jgi:hypothetical protein